MAAQRALDSPDTGTLLHALCRVIDEQSGLRSSIFLLNETGDSLTFAAGPQVPAGWRAVVASFPVTRTACGAAVTERAQIISADIAEDRRYAGYYDAADAAGIRAVWSTPFFSTHDRPLGTFAVYSGLSGRPSDFDLSLVERATALASIAVEHHLTERKVRESEIRFSRTFYATPAPLSISSFAEGRFTYVNDAFVRTFGYSRPEVVGQTARGLGLYADASDRQLMIRLLLEGKARDVEVKGRTKSGELLTLLLSFERVEVLGEDSLLGIATDITHRKQAENALQRGEELLRLVLEAIPVGVVVMDADGNVVLSNPVSALIWGAVVRDGPERYAASAGWWHDSGRRIAPDEWASVRARRTGETSLNEVIDIATFDGQRKIIQNSAVPIRDARQSIVGAVVVNEDISARMAADASLEASASEMRVLAAHLMRAQDDERRHIAQILHETTAQDLAGLKMLLARLGRTVALSDADRTLLAESIDLAERSMSGVRTLSYLLHPPFLDENGLLSAVRWYAKGFADRSGIAVDLDLPAAFDRLPQDVETALFRVVQEALINIHRHAGSATARIRLNAAADRLMLEIEDRGRGMTPDLLSRVVAGGGAGVGIAGMRERLEQLGGSLEIIANDPGTTIRAIVPLRTQSS